jgi:hypothetical protein
LFNEWRRFGVTPGVMIRHGIVVLVVESNDVASWPERRVLAADVRPKRGLPK